MSSSATQKIEILPTPGGATLGLTIAGAGEAERSQRPPADAASEISGLAAELASQGEKIEALSTQLARTHELVAALGADLASKADVPDGLLAAKAEILGLQDKLAASETRQRQLAEASQRYHSAWQAERFTVFRPLYRNIYRVAGRFLRSVLRQDTVDRLRSRIPDPEGIPSHLHHPASSVTPVAAERPMAAATDLPDVFVLSIIDWHFRQQRPQHIARQLSRSRRVFYVEMSPSDEACLIEEKAERLYRVRLPTREAGYVAPYTGRASRSQVECWMKAFAAFCDEVSASPFKQIIVQHPFWWQFARHLSPEYEIAFDCMDDIAGFSNTEPFLLELEAEMVEECDKLIVSSDYLARKFGSGRQFDLVRNAGDDSHFSILPGGRGLPDFLVANRFEKDADRIDAGYVGAIAEWFDHELIAAAAKAAPHVHFHLCGAVTASGPAALERLSNVTLYGEIPYELAPAFLEQMDVALIPFQSIPLIHACDPVKFYEYSAMGLPTVSTPMPELDRVRELVLSAATPTEFVEQLERAAGLAQDEAFCQRLRDFAGANTWQHRGEAFSNALGQHPLVSAVILAFGEAQWTTAALHSLFDPGPAYPDLEVIVVDNGSPPEALSELREACGRHPGVRLIENGENLGFARGNNVGIEAARGEYVLLLNNDTYVAPGAIPSMVRHLSRHPEIGVVGPITNNIGNEARVPVEYADMAEMKRAARDLTSGYRGVFTPLRSVAYFAAMFRRKDLDLFGLLDEAYGLGMFEDDDHCAVIGSHGYVCALAEDAFVHHHLSATFSQMGAERKSALFRRNQQLFESRWGPWTPHTYRDARPPKSLSDS